MNQNYCKSTDVCTYKMGIIYNKIEKSDAFENFRGLLMKLFIYSLKFPTGDNFNYRKYNIKKK